MKKLSRLTTVSILLLLIGLSCTAQTAATPALSKAEAREKVAADIAYNLGAKKYTAARKDFAKIMLDALSEEKLKTDWENLESKMGAFQKVLTTTEEDKNGYKIIKKRCQFASENASILVTFNEEGQIIGLYFKP